MSSPTIKTSETTSHRYPLPARRRLWIHLLLYAVIFVSGGVVGVGATLITLRNRVLYAVHHPEEMPQRIADRMRRVLSLNDEQTRQAVKILQERQQALQGIRRDFQPQVEAELNRVEEQIAEILNDQQRARWHEQFRDLRRDWLPAVPEQK